MATKYELTQEEYRSYPALSTSDIKLILENPYKFKIGYKKESTPSMDLGTLVHCLILEPDTFYHRYIVKNIDRRTKAGKEEFAEIEKSGLTLISEEFYNNALGMAESIRESGAYHKYLKGCDFETSYIGDLLGHTFKVRPDALNLETSTIIDLKCVSNASKSGFLKTFANLKYYMQAYIYKNVLNVQNFYFIAIENKEPYTIGIYEADFLSMELAESELKKALDIYNNIDSIKNIYKDKHAKDDLEAQALTLPNWVFYEND